jgi:hypothetical protein
MDGGMSHTVPAEAGRQIFDTTARQKPRPSNFYQDLAATLDSRNLMKRGSSTRLREVCFSCFLYFFRDKHLTARDR